MSTIKNSDPVPSRYRELFDVLEDGFCVLEMIVDDSDSVIDVRYHDVNQAFETHTGIADIEGHTASEKIPDLEPHWFQYFEEVYKTGVPKRIVDEAQESLGKWYEISVSRLGEKSNRQVACLFKDVTERTESERRLVELAARLSESDRHKTRFLATLAHELRNPLAPIRTGLELMAGLAENPEELEETRSMMIGQVDQVVRLVDDLLDVSRISNGSIRLQPERINLEEIVKRAIDANLPEIESKGHELQTRFPYKPILLVADPVRTTQVVSNLVSNAARYTSDGGEIEVGIKSVNGKATIEVSDNGDGLDKVEVNQIFKMFAQVESESSTGDGGLGIGLALSLQLVELHQGTLEVRSPGRGEGCTFTVTMPIGNSLTEVNSVTKAVAKKALKTYGARVLVVDDNVNAADALVKILGREGFDSSALYCGVDALHAITSDPPDIALLDIGLPDITGYQIATELGKLDCRKDMTLVALTGWGTEVDQQDSMDAGFEHHLTKPVPSDKLLSLLTGIVEQKFGPSASA